MKEYLIETLNAFGYPVVLERSLAPKDYPDTFITFWNFSSSNLVFDNTSTTWTNWGFNIRLYSKSPVVVENTKKLILKALKNAGFIPDGCGNDFTYSPETSHLGWSVDVYYTEENNDAEE